MQAPVESQQPVAQVCAHVAASSPAAASPSSLVVASSAVASSPGVALGSLLGFGDSTPELVPEGSWVTPLDVPELPPLFALALSRAFALPPSREATAPSPAPAWAQDATSSRTARTPPGDDGCRIHER